MAKDSGARWRNGKGSVPHNMPCVRFVSFGFTRHIDASYALRPGQTWRSKGSFVFAIKGSGCKAIKLCKLQASVAGVGSEEAVTCSMLHAQGSYLQAPCRRMTAFGLQGQFNAEMWRLTKICQLRFRAPGSEVRLSVRNIFPFVVQLNA